MNLYAYVLGDPVNLYDPYGLWTIGIGGTFQGGGGLGAGISGGFYFGKDPDCEGWNKGWSSGFLGTVEFGAQSPGGSGAVFGQITNADTVDQLKGWGVVAGGSGSAAGLTGGYEHSRGLNSLPNNSNGIVGHQISGGPGSWGIPGLPGGEGHIGWSNTQGKTWGAKDGGCP